MHVNLTLKYKEIFFTGSNHNKVITSSFIVMERFIMKTVKTLLGDLTPEMYQNLSSDHRFIVLCDLAIQDYRNNENLSGERLKYLETPKKETLFVVTYPNGEREEFTCLKSLAEHCNVTLSMARSRCQRNKPLNDETTIREVTVFNW